MRAPATSTTPPVQLLRRWVVEYFNAHNAAAARDFIAPDYALHIGDVVFAGRDERWLPAVDKQMQLYPGLGMTVHQVIAGDDWAAAYFSEHGASQGRTACWSGVAIYFSDGNRLSRCIAQEDYMTRQRQLKTGLADPVESPAAAPWDTRALLRNIAAEEAVREWLARSWPPANDHVRCDDEHITGVSLQFDVVESTIDVLQSSGADVAFHAHQRGFYVGGLAGVAAYRQPASIHCNGIVQVRDGVVQSGRVIRDRLGMRATLQKAGRP
jgi:SnoaL-like domain